MNFKFGRGYKFSSPGMRTLFVDQDLAIKDDELANVIIGEKEFKIEALDEDQYVTEISVGGTLYTADDFGQDYLLSPEELEFFTVVAVSRQELEEIAEAKFTKLIGELDSSGSLFDKLEQRGVIGLFAEAVAEVLGD